MPKNKDCLNIISYVLEVFLKHYVYAEMELVQEKDLHDVPFDVALHKHSLIYFL